MNESPKRPDVQGAEPVQAPNGSQALDPKSDTHGDEASKASVFEWVSIVFELIFIWPLRLLSRPFQLLFRLFDGIDVFTGGLFDVPVISLAVLGLVFYFAVIKWEWITLDTLLSHVINFIEYVLVLVFQLL